MKRTEAIILLRELGTEHLIQPSSVLIDQREPDRYQLQIKGDYDLQQIEIFLKNRFTIEENKNYLVIYTP